MRAKRFLKQYGEEMILIRKMQHRIEALDDLFSITMDMSRDRVQTSPKPDKIGEIIARKTDLQEALENEIEEAKAVMDEVEDVIGKVEDVKRQLLLHERYIDFMTWEKIAEDLDLSDRWVQVLHQRALEDVEIIIDANPDAQNISKLN